MRRAVLVVALAAAPLVADDVHLKGGGRLSGVILEETADSVTIDIGAGAVTVRISTVTGIEKGTSPLQEYRTRAAAIAATDVDAWRELGRWATSLGLGSQAREAYERVRAVAPDDAEACQALGLVQVGGRWVTEEESYAARGFVDFEGEWMTPRERDAILEERRVREDQDREALASEIRASDAALREREAKEEAEEQRKHDELFLDGSLPQLGDPVYWGYGYGPAYWPTQVVPPGGW